MTIGTNGQHFCESFDANNNTIDYQYSHQMNSGIAHLLFIGHKYWVINSYVNLKTLEYELKLEPEVRGESQWFGKTYKTGFTIWSNKSKAFVTGLVRKDNSSTIDWGIFTGKAGFKYPDRRLNISRVEGNTSLLLEPILSTSGSRSVLIGSRISMKKGTYFRYREIELQLNEDNQINLTQKEHLPDINDRTMELIAIFHDEDDRRGMSFLYSVNKSIIYCIHETNEDKAVRNLSVY